MFGKSLLTASVLLLSAASAAAGDAEAFRDEAAFVREIAPRGKRIGFHVLPGGREIQSQCTTRGKTNEATLTGREWSALGVTLDSPSELRVCAQIANRRSPPSPPLFLTPGGPPGQPDDDDNADSLTIRFAKPVYAAGIVVIDNDKTSPTERVDVIGPKGTVILSASMPHESGHAFIGFRSAEGILEIRIFEDANDRDDVAYDDLRFQATPTPTEVVPAGLQGFDLPSTAYVGEAIEIGYEGLAGRTHTFVLVPEGSSSVKSGIVVEKVSGPDGGRIRYVPTAAPGRYEILLVAGATGRVVGRRPLVLKERTPSGGRRVWTEKPVYDPGERVILRFAGMPTNRPLEFRITAIGKTSWQDHRVVRTAGKAAGRLVFEGMSEGGSRRVLVLANPEQPTELARCEFNVRSWTVPDERREQR